MSRKALDPQLLHKKSSGLSKPYLCIWAPFFHLRTFCPYASNRDSSGSCGEPNCSKWLLARCRLPCWSVRLRLLMGWIRNFHGQRNESRDGGLSSMMTWESSVSSFCQRSSLLQSELRSTILSERRFASLDTDNAACFTDPHFRRDQEFLINVALIEQASCRLVLHDRQMFAGSQILYAQLPQASPQASGNLDNLTVSELMLKSDVRSPAYKMLGTCGSETVDAAQTIVALAGAMDSSNQEFGGTYPTSRTTDGVDSTPLAAPNICSTPPLLMSMVAQGFIQLLETQ